ncbi:MAG: hypothetical protein GC161_18425 [Planctomycetaceae bacterium]|nr:hypothetical protein [Planctomycetaceae bacterium]
MEALRILARRLAGKVRRGLVLGTDESGGLPRAQMRMGAREVRSLVERLEHYGFAYRPLDGSEALVFDLGGGHLVSAASGDRRYRPKDLEPGEVALYRQGGSQVRLRTDDSIALLPANGIVHVQGTLQVSGSVEAAGEVTAGGDVSDGVGSMQAMRDTYNHHNHGSGPLPTPPMA